MQINVLTRKSKCQTSNNKILDFLVMKTLHDLVEFLRQDFFWRCGREGRDLVDTIRKANTSKKC